MLCWQIRTQLFVWYLCPPGKLTPTATAALDGATNAGDPIYVATISLVKLTYLVEKGRLPDAALVRLQNVMTNPRSGLLPVALDLAVVQAVRRIPRTAIPEMPDRIIAATTLHLGVPLVTRDLNIRAAGVTTIW